MYKTKTLVFMVAVICLFTSCGLLKPVATISRIDGTLMINGKEAAKDTKLRQGDVLTTDAADDALVDLQFTDGHTVRLRNGELKIEKASGSVLMDMTKGKLFIYAKKLKKDRSFKIKTPISIVGIRGTKFMMEETPDKTYYCVCEGQVAAKNLTFEEEEVLIDAGQDLYVKQGQKTEDPIESPDMVKMTLMEFMDMGVK